MAIFLVEEVGTFVPRCFMKVDYNNDSVLIFDQPFIPLILRLELVKYAEYPAAGYDAFMRGANLQGRSGIGS